MFFKYQWHNQFW